MKTKTLLLFALIVLLGSCGVTHILTYEINIEEVRLNDEKLPYSAINGYVYANDDFSITLIPNKKSISFIIKNLSKNPYTILWDESAIIDIEGISNKIVTEDTRFINSEKSIIPMIVAPYSTGKTTLFGLNQVNGYSDGWSLKELFPTRESKHIDRMESYVSSLNDSYHIQTYIVIKKHDDTKMYLMTTFKYSNFRIK